MKSIIAFAAVLALVGTVDAAPTTTKVKSAKLASAKRASSKGVNVAAVSKSAKADAIEASNVDIKQTAPLAEVAPKTAVKKWSAGLDVDSYSPIKGMNEGTADIESFNTAKVGYKVADTMTLTVAQDWVQTYGVGADTNKADSTMLDPSVRLSKSDLADLGNGVGLSGQARIYLPVSESSQDKEQLAQIRVYLTASREITKALSASFTLNPRIFAQQNDTYINDEGKPDNLDTFRLLSFAGVKYAINDKVALEQAFGVYQKWKTNTARADYLYAESFATVAIASWFELSGGIRQIDGATDMRKTGLSGLYSADQAEYFLMGSFSI
jgi:hypothetical protein